MFRWGSTFNLYSFLKVWVAYDGNFVEVVPSPSTKGQHCGICGNYNRQQGHRAIENVVGMSLTRVIRYRGHPIRDIVYLSEKLREMTL